MCIRDSPRGELSTRVLRPDLHLARARASARSRPRAEALPRVASRRGRAPRGGAERGLVAGEALPGILVPSRSAAPSLPLQPSLAGGRADTGRLPRGAAAHALLGAEPVRHPPERAERAGLPARRILRGPEREPLDLLQPAAPPRGDPDRAARARGAPLHGPGSRVRRRGDAGMRRAPDRPAPVS